MSGNTLIQGDNLDVLRWLAEDYTSEVRCIYLDPPYNNEERYTHYRDDAGHPQWRSQMQATLSLLLPLLRRDGSIWISIDDTEVHYLKVMADEVFGRDRFVHTVVWEHRKSRENRRAFSNNHEYVLVYAADPTVFARERNRVSAAERLRPRYKNPDVDPRGPWQSVTLNVQAGHGTPAQFYSVVALNGRKHDPPKGRCWIYAEPKMRCLIDEGRIWFGRDGNGVPRLKRYLNESDLSVSPETLWRADEVGTTTDAKREVLGLLPDLAVFDTPKPEALLRRILEISTKPGDLVLDPFLGCATTTAVAHKLGRRYIGIEIGEHATTHCVTRMCRVVDGEAGGVSSDVGWQGGGGFEFIRQLGEAELVA
jgi:adenine-specific DNA-methyltransferase